MYKMADAAFEARLKLLEEQQTNLKNVQEKLDRDLDKEYHRREDLRDDMKVFGEALAATGREQQKERGHHNLTVFAKGDFEKEVLQALNKYKQDAKTKRNATASAAPASAPAGAASAASAPAQAMDTSTDENFNVKFHKVLVTWFEDQIGNGGPRALELREKMEPVVQRLGGIDPYLAYDFVRVLGKKNNLGATVCNVSIRGGTAGSALWEHLVLQLRPFYRLKGTFQDCSIKEDNGGGKDRPLIAKVCDIVGIDKRDGKGKGKNESKSNTKEERNVHGKRVSPERGGAPQKTRR